MGLSRFLLPSLSVRALCVAERLMIASVSLIQIAFLLIRHPLLFGRPALDASVRLLGLFLASPMAIAGLAGLLIGYLATGVVQVGAESPERWNIRRTVQATAVAAAGGLVSVCLFIPGLFLGRPWGYGLIAAGFFLGPWLPVRLVWRAKGPSSTWPKRRELLRSLVAVLAFFVVWMADVTAVLSIEDNRLFLKEARNASPALLNSPTDPSIKVARLSSGLIRYREMNPRGRHVVLAFPGWQESIYEFPLALQSKLETLDVRGIVIERPGVGPMSTAWPGYGLAEWAGLVEEFDNTVLGGTPVSIVGHSAGGVYALACARLACVRALGLVSSPEPTTYGSFLHMLFVNTGSPATVVAVQLFPHMLLPNLQRSCQQMSSDWKSYKVDMAKVLGPTDAAMIDRNDDDFRRNMVTSVVQGAAASLDDGRGMFSPWPLTLADTTRLPIVIFRGAGDQFIPLAATDDLQKRFAPHATRMDFPDMGHQPALAHYERVFEVVRKLHVQAENK
jgi:pimeloyl-ACP methyl ester carboxylesterase